jgi:hypothetical protein
MTSVINPTFNINSLRQYGDLDVSVYDIFFGEIIEMLSGNSSYLDRYFTVQDANEFFLFFNRSRLTVPEAYCQWEKRYGNPKIDNGIITHGTPSPTLAGGNEDVYELKKNELLIGKKPVERQYFEMLYSFLKQHTRAECIYHGKQIFVTVDDLFDKDYTKMLFAEKIFSPPITENACINGFEAPSVAPITIVLKPERRKIIFIGIDTITLKGTLKKENLCEDESVRIQQKEFFFKRKPNKNIYSFKYMDLFLEMGYNYLEVDLFSFEKLEMIIDPFLDAVFKEKQCYHESIYPYYFDFQSYSFFKYGQGELAGPGIINWEASKGSFVMLAALFQPQRTLEEGSVTSRQLLAYVFSFSRKLLRKVSDRRMRIKGFFLCQFVHSYILQYLGAQPGQKLGPYRLFPPEGPPIQMETFMIVHPCQKEQKDTPEDLVRLVYGLKKVDIPRDIIMEFKIPVFSVLMRLGKGKVRVLEKMLISPI